MSNPVIRIKVTPKQQIRGKMDVRFPARVLPDDFITIEKANGNYKIGADYRKIADATTYDPANNYIAIQMADGSFARISIGTLLTNTEATVRVVTEAGDIVVGAATQLLVMNRTADESPSNIILPASAQKVGKIKVVDFKGNAGTYPHTISVQGSDTFQSGLTTWTLGGDGSSVALDPVPNLGYAV